MKSSDNLNSPTATRKVCNNCNSTGHLTFACKKVKVKNIESSSMPAMPTLNAHLPCGVVRLYAMCF